MSTHSRLLIFSLLVLCSAVGCDGLRLDGDTTFAGTVLDQGSSAPIEGATVSVAGIVATTDASGAYALTVEADSSDQVFTLSISAEGYEPYTATARADVGDTVTLPAARLVLEGGGTDLPTGPSGPGTSVSLMERSAETVGVSGAGGLETATLEFAVLDAQGRPVSLDNAVELEFVLASGPGGGETIAPERATTGPDGHAEVTLTSGTRSGTVQVLARGTADGVALRALPVTITITGGLPDDAHFSVAPEQLNFAGYNRFGLTNAVTAYVGDRYGNPVQPGTAVYFTTDGGIIPGSGVTSDAGTATVDLLSAAPRPVNALACSPNPNGYARVTASTSDENQARIEDTATVLFSGVTQIRIEEPSGLELGSYRYVVADPFDHPLAPGTQISVEVEGVNIKATGATSVELGDFLCPGRGRTEFSFTASVSDPAGDAPVLEALTITVESPNGNAQLTRTASGVTGEVRDVLARDD